MSIVLVVVLSFARRADFYGVSHFILASLGNVHYNADAWRQITDLALLVVFREFRLIVQLHVDVPLSGLHGQDVIGYLHDGAPYVVKSTVGVNRRCGGDEDND